MLAVGRRAGMLHACVMFGRRRACRGRVPDPLAFRPVDPGLHRPRALAGGSCTICAGCTQLIDPTLLGPYWAYGLPAVC